MVTTMKVDYHEELEKVLEIVKRHPKGCTIREVSEELGINRNAVAKYLDVLQVAGQVEMRRVGPAKVYFPSKSVPISVLFDFSDEFIIIVDEKLVTVEANRPFLRYIDVSDKKEIIGKPVTELPMFNSFPKMTENIKKALEEYQILEERFTFGGDGGIKPEEFIAKFIPTTFNNGEKGVALLIKKL